MEQVRVSPCLGCTRVENPEECENKKCKPWQAWFLGRWELIHQYSRRQMDNSVPQPAGVPLGGRHYALPHQVEAYLGADPCEDCQCPKDLCTSPCRVRRAWKEARKESGL